MTSSISRRTVLTASAAGLSTMAVAACSSSSKNNSPGTSAGSSSDQPPASSAAPSSSSAGSPTSAGTVASASTAGGAALVSLASIKVGEAAAVKLPDGKPGIVARPTATTAVAFSALCTHQQCTVKPAGKELHCPCHGSKYNALTGAVLHGPAPSPLPKVEVHVASGNVVAGA